VDNRSYIDNRASACLCDVGLPSYVAAVLVAGDGRQDLVLVDQELIGDGQHTYNHTTPEAAHDQLGPLPLEFVRRITVSSRVHRCGRRTKTARPAERQWSAPVIRAAGIAHRREHEAGHRQAEPAARRRSPPRQRRLPGLRRPALVTRRPHRPVPAKGRHIHHHQPTNGETMTTPDHNALDSLRYLNSHCKQLLDWVVDRLGWSLIDGLTETETEDLQAALESIQADIRAELQVHASDAKMPGRLQHYSDGRPVETVLEIENGNIYHHTWHPDVTHRVNQPQEHGPHVTTSGARKTIIITAPGVLDVADARPNLRPVR
jgi:hypothetical protein